MDVGFQLEHFKLQKLYISPYLKYLNIPSLIIKESVLSLVKFVEIDPRYVSKYTMLVADQFYTYQKVNFQRVASKKKKDSETSTKKCQ